MTIPKIGDKIVRVRSQASPVPVDITEPVAEQQEVVNNQESFEEADIPEFEDASLDDVFDDDEVFDKAAEESSDIQPEDNSEPEQTEQAEQESVINSRHPEDNYSIDKFTEEFTDKLQKDVMPMLVQYDPERRQGLILACLLTGVLVFAAVAVLLFVELPIDKKLCLALLLVMISVVSWFFISRNLEKKVKNGVMPLLIKAIPGFSWISESPIPEEDINESKIFYNSKEAVKNFYNAFDGQYRGVDVSIVEAKYSAEKQELFAGVIIRLKMKKDFIGTTVIRPKKEVLIKSVKDLKKLRYSKYELSDAELNKLYNVYTSDQEEARMLLTPEFIECFKQIYTAFGTNIAFCSCAGKYIYVAPYFKDSFFAKKDLFNVCSLFKNVADEAQYVTLYNELTSVMALVDALKLVNKIGL